MSLRSIFKGAALVTASAALIAVITIGRNPGLRLLPLQWRSELGCPGVQNFLRPDLGRDGL